MVFSSHLLLVVVDDRECKPNISFLGMQCEVVVAMDSFKCSESFFIFSNWYCFCIYFTSLYGAFARDHRIKSMTFRVCHLSTPLLVKRSFLSSLSVPRVLHSGLEVKSLAWILFPHVIVFYACSDMKKSPEYQWWFDHERRSDARQICNR